MRVAIEPVTSPRWRALLDRVAHDFYHLPAYGELSAKRDGGEPLALVVEEEERALLLPFVRRPIANAGSAWDGISPYGYPGPLVVGAEGAEAVNLAARAIDAATGPLAELGAVSLFVRCHPLLGVTPRPAAGALVQHGETIVIDPAKSETEHWAETMSGHRNEINRALRAGHRAFFDDDFVHVGRFVDIYQDTMRRVGASAYYFFDRDYVHDLRAALGDSLRLAFVEIDGTLAAGGLFVRTGGMVQYHLSGTDGAFTRHQPTKLLLHFIRGWARETGARAFHLGGGVGGGQDSLFRFKAGFSKGRAAFHTLRIVIDPDRYRMLARERHPDAEPDDYAGFFPLYRRP